MLFSHSLHLSICLPAYIFSSFNYWLWYGLRLINAHKFLENIIFLFHHFLSSFTKKMYKAPYLLSHIFHLCGRYPKALPHLISCYLSSCFIVPVATQMMIHKKLHCFIIFILFHLPIIHHIIIKFDENLLEFFHCPILILFHLSYRRCGRGSRRRRSSKLSVMVCHFSNHIKWTTTQ